MTFAETALAAGLGSAFGAWFAFRFNLLVEKRRRRTDEILAGHVAVGLLSAKLLYIDMVEEAWRAGEANPGPEWWQFQAPARFPEDPRRVDVGSLGFLLAKGHRRAIAEVIEAEHGYFDLMGALGDYREFYVTKLHPAMHAAGVPERLTSTEATGNERKLPRDILLKIYDLHGQLGARVETVPGIVRNATSYLQNSLKAVFPAETFDVPQDESKAA
jgi:hypothetical protein